VSRQHYINSPRGIDEKIRLTSRFLQIKIKEYEALKAEIEDLQEELEYAHNKD
jgi:hypothetical protein